MTIETAIYVADLDPVQPPDSDLVAEGDDHLRLIKNVLLATFPGRGLADSEVLNKTANFTAGLAEVSAIYNVTVASTAALPALSGLVPGTYYLVWANGVAVTVDPSGTELVNGATTLSLAADTGCLLAPAGGEWLAMVFGLGTGGGGGGLAYGPTNNSWGGENTINPGGSNNTAIGFEALILNSGNSNTVVGAGGLSATNASSGNTIIGASMFAGASPGIENTAVGLACGGASSTGDRNILIGSYIGQSFTTADYNIGIGVGVLATEDVGTSNIAIGRDAMAASSGSQNQVAIGTNALENVVNVPTYPNIAIGYQAAQNLSIGGDNICIGTSVASSLIAANANVVIGGEADVGVSSTGNALVGRRAKGGTTGYNSVIGAEGLGGVTSGSYNTAAGYYALNTLTTQTNCSGLGYQTAVTGSNQVQLGDSNTTTYAYGAVQARSDARDKADVSNTKLGLAFILSLRPVEFRWDYREDYPNRISDGSKKRSRLHQGLIAQEVQDVVDASGLDFAGLQHHQIAGGEDVYSIGYSELITPLIKALQELTEEFRAYKEAHP
jgi:trimeric autotransporter adhesin